MISINEAKRLIKRTLLANIVSDKPNLALTPLVSEQRQDLPEEMAEAMKKDKKAEGGKVHFVLPREIGKVEIVDLTVDEVVELLK